MIISNLYPPYILGGYEILCEQVVTQLEKRGHEVHILTSDHESSEDSPQVERSLKIFVPFDKKPQGFERSKRAQTAKVNYHSTVHAIGRIQPDIIFIWSLLRATPSPAKAAEISGIPVFYTFNDENIAGYTKRALQASPSAIVNWFLDSFITPNITLTGLSFEHTTCISQVTKDNIIGKGVGIQSSKVIHQGIPVEKFPKRNNPYGFMHSPIRILYAGQVHDYKGVHTIIEALGALKGAHELPHCTLTIAGTGTESYIEELHRKADIAGISPEFLGRVPHDTMPELYRKHDIFIFPSIWEEPFGLTHLEAMSSGLPVISTTNGGQREFLTHEENCLSFTPADHKELAQALKRLFSDAPLRKRLAKAGRETAITRYTFDRYVDALNQELMKLTSTG